MILALVDFPQVARETVCAHDRSDDFIQGEACSWIEFAAKLLPRNSSHSRQSISPVDSASQRTSQCQHYCGAHPRFLNHSYHKSTSSSASWCTKFFRTDDSTTAFCEPYSHSRMTYPQRILALVLPASRREPRSDDFVLPSHPSGQLYARGYR